jgi:hypothetical protein
MGGGTSRNLLPPEPTDGELGALGSPFSKGDDSMYFFALPSDDEWKKVGA